jgi:hypothetical protein
MIPPGQGHILTARGSVAAHTFGNRTAEQARLLVLHAPAMDAYFEELDRLWSGPEPPDRSAERALMERYGMDPA